MIASGDAVHPADLPSAGFVSRALALTIDALIIGVCVALSAFTMSMISSLVSLRLRPRLDDSTLAVITGVAGTVFAIGYHAVCWSLSGRTPGKAIMGIQVVRLDGNLMSLGRATLRFLCYSVSAFPLGLGFLWVLWRSDRRAWHDLLTKTRVVYLPNRSSGHLVEVMTRVEDRISTHVQEVDRSVSLSSGFDSDTREDLERPRLDTSKATTLTK